MDFDSIFDCKQSDPMSRGDYHQIAQVCLFALKCQFSGLNVMSRLLFPTRSRYAIFPTLL